MHSLTNEKPKKINDKYFPIAFNSDEGEAYFVKENSYDDFREYIDEIIGGDYEPDEVNEIMDLLLEYMDSGRIPSEAEKYNDHRGQNILNYLKRMIDNEHHGQQCKKLTIDGVRHSGSRLMKIPNLLSWDAINVYGASGSGKSHWTAEYVKICRKFHKNMPIFLITTNVDNDPLYKGLGIRKLDISDRDFLENYDFNETSFQDSLVIFDDIETYDRGIDMWIRKLRDTLFLKARKHKTYIVNIIHKGLNNHTTRIPNNECNFGVFFPRHSWSEAKKILEYYFGLSVKQISSLRQLRTKSRWICVSKTYPKYVIHEKGIVLL